jgi:cytoskeletal protein RodZ
MLAVRAVGLRHLPLHQREVGMTRTDVVAPSGPRKAGATSLSKESSRAWRRLSVVPIALVMAALLLPQSAFAQSTTGYSQTVPPPKTTTTPATSTTPSTTPTTGAAPSKEEKTTSEKTTPSKETSPSSTTPTSSTSPAKAGALPFTGLDLRLVLGGGLVLFGAGFGLLLLDRRRRPSR